MLERLDCGTNRRVRGGTWAEARRGAASAVRRVMLIASCLPDVPEHGARRAEYAGDVAPPHAGLPVEAERDIGHHLHRAPVQRLGDAVRFGRIAGLDPLRA